MSDRKRVTLAEWAAKKGRSAKSVNNFWRSEPDFPTPIGHRASARGRPPAEWLEEELDTWFNRWAERTQSGVFAVPGDPEEYLTLTAIARRLGINDKTISQERARIDEEVDSRPHNTRTLYRLGGVIDFLNQRPGRGVASDPGTDRRRSESSPHPQHPPGTPDETSSRKGLQPRE